MTVLTILYGNYYPPHGEYELICIGKFSRRTWVNFTQQYGKNRQRCQRNKFTMLYGNYCYIFIENFPQKFSPCSVYSRIVTFFWQYLFLTIIIIGQRTFRALRKMVKNQNRSILVIIAYFRNWVKRQFFTTSKIPDFQNSSKILLLPFDRGHSN